MTKDELLVAAEDYDGLYVKVVVDVVTGAMAVGGEWHADGEKELLRLGSKQANLWGGGVRLANMQIDFNSLINTRPGLNNSQEILDPKIRNRFEMLVKQKFGP